jgi:hypothetical protein
MESWEKTAQTLRKVARAKRELAVSFDVVAQQLRDESHYLDEQAAQIADLELGLGEISCMEREA